MNILFQRSFFIIAGGILILLIGIGIGSGLSKTAPASSPALLPAQEALRDSKPSDGSVKVIRVIDGDTIEIEGGERVRYIGIDTPETVDPRKPVQCFGVEASKKNKELVEGQKVRLEKDVTERDKYNRLLRYVWAGDIFINLELVKQGFAQSYSYPPDIKYQNRFIEAQREAREAAKGLWGACPAGSKTIVAPSPASTESNADNSCVIKGNIGASGEKIYHLPDCGSYTKTQIDVGRNERWFCSEAEAQTAGWRRALNCP
ncbi:MAG: thermonuclease family protein [Candidatus Liptonbacteria bacterium]|nr:thermonuclease family protein [Candidatus Liptonbacteria bacterium]